jgi:NAD(P)H-dependent flavin oxidoreductase YrpB (nitropropane dioxygenase family)
MRRSHRLPLAQVLLAANTPALLRAAMIDGKPEFGVMATGQVAGLIDDLPSCTELVERIVAQAEAVLARLADSGDKPASAPAGDGSPTGTSERRNP